MPPSRGCSIPECPHPHVARGWCWRHYQRWRRHGDPLLGGRPAAKPKVERERPTLEQRFWARVDTLAATSEQGWWGSNASAPRGLGGLTNELAAMPSLHVGWALWCTWVVYLCCTRRSVRILALAYTAGTTVVVVATANHFVLDVVAGAAVIALGFALTAGSSWVRRNDRSVRGAGPGAAPRLGRTSGPPRPPGSPLDGSGTVPTARHRR